MSYISSYTVKSQITTIVKEIKFDIVIKSLQTELLLLVDKCRNQTSNHSQFLLAEQK